MGEDREHLVYALGRRFEQSLEPWVVECRMRRRIDDSFSLLPGDEASSLQRRQMDVREFPVHRLYESGIGIGCPLGRGSDIVRELLLGEWWAPLAERTKDLTPGTGCETFERGILWIAPPSLSYPLRLGVDE